MESIKKVVIVVCVIIGTLIGAGFASGKEIYLFFSKYGIYGIIGAVVSSILTAVIILKVLKISRNNNLTNNNKFVEKITKNKEIASIIKNIINMFLFISYWIMSTGLATFFKQEMGIPIVITSTLNSVVVYFIFMKSVKGIMNLNSIVVPIMIIIILVISMKNFPVSDFFTYTNDIYKKAPVAETMPDAIKATTKAILYTSYNSITLIPIIVTLSSSINKKKEIRGVSLITGILVFILIFSIYKMLILSNLDIKLYEIPVLEILSGFTKTEKILYEIAIVAAIFTSEISAGFGILENIREKEKYKIVALIMCVLGIPISYIGFGRLVEVLYPVFGIIGLLQIILIVAFRAKVNYK